MRHELGRDLQQIADRVSKLVVAIHTAPIERALERSAIPDPFEAYEGSVEHGALLKEFSSRRSVVVICGHRHRPLEEDGIRVMRNPVGYLNRAITEYARQAREGIGMLVL